MNQQELRRGMHEAIKAARKERYCSHPEASPSTCGDRLVNAHTVSRSSGLARIADAGHVYQLKPDAWADDDDDRIVVKKVGIKDATTFRGFCNVHDASTFAPIETVQFVASEQQCFLHGYRALCLEYYRKRVQARAHERCLAIYSGSTYRNRLLLEHLEKQLWYVQQGMHEYQHHKSLYDNAFLSGDYRDFRALAFLTADTPRFLLCGGPTAVTDFAGRRVQVLIEPPSCKSQPCLSWRLTRAAPRCSTGIA